MSSRSNSIIGMVASAAALSLCASACVDPNGSFEDFNKRVIDADTTRIDGANIGEIPDVNGEFFLNLSPSIASNLLLKFIVTTTLDTTNGAKLGLTLQPLCVQESKCTVLQPIGDPFSVSDLEINGAGEYTANFVDVFVPGGANPISGSDIIGNLEMLGTIKSADLYCGIVNGTADTGAVIPIDGSTFGAIRITPGTLGNDLPEAVFACPADVPDVDAGVPDAGPADAGPADASPGDAAA